MSDDELAKFLGVADEPFRDKFIAALTPEKRELFEKMRAVELWDAAIADIRARPLTKEKSDE